MKKTILLVCLMYAVIDCSAASNLHKGSFYSEQEAAASIAQAVSQQIEQAQVQLLLQEKNTKAQEIKQLLNTFTARLQQVDSKHRIASNAALFFLYQIAAQDIFFNMEEDFRLIRQEAVRAGKNPEREVAIYMDLCFHAMDYAFVQLFNCSETKVFLYHGRFSSYDNGQYFPIEQYHSWASFWSEVDYQEKIIYNYLATFADPAQVIDQELTKEWEKIQTDEPVGYWTYSKNFK